MRRPQPSGDQIPADGDLVRADGLALDESELTGESEPVVRRVGNQVLSGSFAVEGEGDFEATAVGAESHAAKLTATARAFRHPRSPWEKAMDRLLVHAGRVVFVEVKSPEKFKTFPANAHERAQLREMDRFREQGADVRIVGTKLQVDALVREMVG